MQSILWLPVQRGRIVKGEGEEQGVSKVQGQKKTGKKTNRTAACQTAVVKLTKRTLQLST